MKGMYSRQLLQLPSPHSDHRRGKTFGSSDDRNATKNNVVATSRSELPALRKLSKSPLLPALPTITAILAADC